MVKRIVSPDVLQDAFVPRAERVKKYSGTWVKVVREIFPGYFVSVTSDVLALSKALSNLSFPAYLVGPVGHGWAPVDEDVRAFLESCMDGERVIRASEGEIRGGQLTVLHGPLYGNESRVARINRGKCFAQVRVGSDRTGFTLPMPLSVPLKV